MKFLHEEAPTWIRFSKVKAKCVNDTRLVIVEMALQLDATNTKKMPPFVRDAWESMRKADSGVILQEIDRKIDSQNLSFYALQEDKTPRIEIEEVDLLGLRLEKNADKKVWLFFTFEQELGAELWKWVGQSFGREIAVSFEECQQELALEGKAKAAGA
jgi:hypothetical protein